MRRQLTAGIIAFAVAATTACGKSAEQQQAEKAAEAITQAAAEMEKGGAAQMAQGVEAMAKGFEQMAKGAGGKVEVVDFEKLGAAFPEVSGWTRDKVTGSSTTFPMAMSQAETSYSNGDARVELEVVDTALNQMLFAPISMFLASNFSERSSEGYKKGTSIKGEPGFEEVNTQNETAELTVVVGKRFIVTSRGSHGAGIEPVRAVLEKMDFGKLTAAK
jgi:hypothetical protein